MLGLKRSYRSAFVLGVLLLGSACVSQRVDPEFERVWEAAERVMLTDGPWRPEFRDGRTLFLRAGNGMAFRGSRSQPLIGYGDGWDWEAYSLGKDEAGTELWFWSNTKMIGSWSEQSPFRTDWGISVVRHEAAGSTITLERGVPQFDLPSRAERTKSSDVAFVRIISEGPEGDPYWDDAVIVWTTRGKAVELEEKPFQAAHVYRDSESGQIAISRIDISLGEVIGNPPWQSGRRIRF